MVITIDGPAGAGKSTIAIRVASRLGYRFLDTGSMYRVATLLALRDHSDWSDASRLAELATSMELDLRGDRVLLGDEDVTLAIRSPEVTQNVGKVADQPAVRRELIRRQREIVASGDVVTEGRDQGTAAFPDAEVKFFLTASAEERAQRRQNQLREQGTEVSFEELLAEQNGRDERDYNRSAGPLIRPDDAVEICSDGMSIDEVVDTMVRVAESTKADVDHPA